MPVEPPVIDLDTQEPARPDSRRAGGAGGTVRVLAALVVGLLVGGVGVSVLRDHRDQRARDSVVALVATPTGATETGGSAGGNAWVAGHLMVVNAGPEPVTVRSVRAQRDGLLLADDKHSVTIRSAGTGWIRVRMEFDCATQFEPTPLTLRFSVQTADRRVREVGHPVALIGSSWLETGIQICPRG
ncbi:hypothetical protein K7640_20705 [Micromonospora sp. PLK6-60]|uniref:hypothetical protein n=1 Tax=Micromonospora sp. PLK6-60 TaxID=2873383 RepID=UPI001CA7744A|nr:hypothetical protein [Micromonospora sp. PLK6-60]MBY8874254.1 hypothetical protein [Micromonospora sp. PLK6-60]